MKSCDTLVSIFKDKEGEKHVIFGKNSDRPPSEVQLISYIPSAEHPTNSTIECTYIEIPQVEKTAAVLLSKPYWMWGAEMGANEHGVAIGNEAVWTKLEYRKEGLLGMDLLRLGLERGETAKDAMDVIISLLETYHQGGWCDVSEDMLYHNSFLIADSNEAWVLETADDWWVAEKVKEGSRNISNNLSITDAGDLRKDGIVDWAIEKRYCENKESFNFAQIFSSQWSPDLSPKSREGRAKNLLEKLPNEDFKWNYVPKMAEILRDHEGGICMHGGFLSAGSQISLLTPNLDSHFFTVTAPPCKSMYFPFAFSTKNAAIYPDAPQSKIKEDWLWLEHRKIRMHIPSLEAGKENPLQKLETNMFNEVKQISQDNSTQVGKNKGIAKANRKYIQKYREYLKKISF